MLIILFLFLSSLTYCEDKNLFFINMQDVEEIKLKNIILSSPYDDKNFKKFIKNHSYSVFSYYILEKSNYFQKNPKYKTFILNKYKIEKNCCKPKVYNKFLLLENLKKKFYSNLDKKIALKIAETYSQHKKYNDAEPFYIFSQPEKVNITYIYENEDLMNKLSFFSKELELFHSKIINKKILMDEALKSFQNKKFDISKAYYKKLLVDIKVLTKKEYKEIFLKLGEINFYQNNYKESLDYLKKLEKISTIEEKIMCIYYIALCYYKTKEYKKSLSYFDDIKKFYPFTIWERKASIYIEKIKSEV